MSLGTQICESSAYGYCLKNEYKRILRLRFAGLGIPVGFGFANREKIEFERRTQSELGFPIGVSSLRSKLEEKQFEFQRKFKLPVLEKKTLSKKSFGNGKKLF